MRFRTQSLRVPSAALFLVCAAGGFAQDTGPTVVPRSMRVPPIDINSVQPFTADTILTMGPSTAPASTGVLSNAPIGEATTTTGAGGNINGLDTVPTFAGAFAVENGPTTDDPFPVGTIFPFVMMGNDPLVGGTTSIPAKITEVSLMLLNANGSLFKTVPFTSTFEDVMTDSPNFANSVFDSSSTVTQFADAVQRAEFFHTAKSSWHTRLSGPSIVNRVVFTIPAKVKVQFPDGKIENVTSYFTEAAPDGSTVVFLLDLLFQAKLGNAVVNDISANRFTTNALNMDLLPNTYLFSSNEAHPNMPGPCCVLGFHTFVLQTGVTPQPRWLVLFASYISPNITGFGPLADVTAMSHEISESFNDPFLSNATPVWQFPGQPANSKVCQGNLETGDPIENLLDPVVAITLTEGTKSLTFHPQTEALLQWFEMGATSNALDGAFSFPNKSLLTQSAVPCP